MLTFIKRLFNISCMLGFHDNVDIVKMNICDVDDMVRKNIADKGGEAIVINTFPWPKRPSRFLTSSVCSCCGKYTNEIGIYSMKRSKFYLSIYDKHYKAVKKYLDDNKETLDVVRKKMEDKKEQEEKSGWDINS